MQVILPKEVEGFLLTLDKPALAKVRRYRDLLEKHGYQLRMPYSRNILPGVFELRVIGKENIRLVYAFHSNAAIVFHAFAKKTQKIDRKDMEAIISKCRSLFQ
jgi:phage-related protein